MAYAVSSCVAAMCRNLVAGASDFSSSTSPTDSQVNGWLSSGCSLINAQLASKGYGAIPASSAAYELAAQANALYAGWLAERSRTNARMSADERGRADMLKDDFDAQMKVLMDVDLSRMGVSQTSVAYAGGISIAGKDTVEADTDRVLPRFTRGMFDRKE